MATKPAKPTLLKRLRPTPMARLALLVGVALHLAGFAFFHITQPEIEPREPAEPFISYAGEAGFDESKAWLEQSALFDSAPLFLPTVWNASVHNGETASIEIPELFAGFEGEVSFGEDALMLTPPVAAVITDPTAFLQRSSPAIPEPGLATEQVPPPSAEGRTRSGRAEIRDASTGALIATPALPSLPEANSGETLLRPLQYYVQIGPGGVVGAPLLVTGSGNSTIDAEAERWLRQSDRIRRLDFGYYAVTMAY